MHQLGLGVQAEHITPGLLTTHKVGLHSAIYMVHPAARAHCQGHCFQSCEEQSACPQRRCQTLRHTMPAPWLRVQVAAWESLA